VFFFWGLVVGAVWAIFCGSHRFALLRLVFCLAFRRFRSALPFFDLSSCCLPVLSFGSFFGLTSRISRKVGNTWPALHSWACILGYQSLRWYSNTAPGSQSGYWNVKVN